MKSKTSIIFTILTAVMFFAVSCSSINLPQSGRADDYIEENTVPLPIQETSILSGLSDTETEGLYTALDSIYSSYRPPAAVRRRRNHCRNAQRTGRTFYR